MSTYFSIITVCLNSEKTLARTIDSIRNQTFRDVEYIIIDGGSTDSTLSIINDNKDIINIFHTGKDHGIYDAMNKGLSLATGKWIGIINSDDWYEPYTFQTIFDLSKNMNEGVIHGLCRYYKGEKVDKVMGIHHNNLRRWLFVTQLALFQVLCTRNMETLIQILLLPPIMTYFFAFI